MVARNKKMVKMGCKLNIFYTFVFIAVVATNPTAGKAKQKPTSEVADKPGNRH